MSPDDWVTAGYAHPLLRGMITSTRLGGVSQAAAKRYAHLVTLIIEEDGTQISTAGEGDPAAIAATLTSTLGGGPASRQCESTQRVAMDVKIVPSSG
jgi:hypothetical protein